jgi:glycosyltransferase involved in cell wall biosynthesis
MDPAVTVIVSTRNRAGYLGACLASLAEQRYAAPFEVVVVDNASTDDTPDVIERWVETDPRFRSVREERVGLSFGKNAGIEAARGSILLFTDDDVIVDQDWIGSYHALFAEREDLIIGGPIIPIRHDLGEWPEWLADDALDDIGRLHYRSDRPLQSREHVWGGNMAIPAKIFREIGRWNVELGLPNPDSFEDTEFQDRARAAGIAVLFAHTPIVRHRVDASKVSPRAVLSAAFARGRNAYHQERLGIHIQTERLSLTRPSAALVAFVRYGTGWIAWAAASRARLRARSFERARRDAWAAGWAIEHLRDGRQSRISGRVLLRATVLLWRFASRLAAGEGSGV